MPEGMTLPEGVTMPEGGFVRPEGSNRPEGGNRPEGDYTRPQGDFDPSQFQGQFPEGDFTMPEGITMPEGMTRPEGGKMPSFNGESGRGELQVETTAVDLANAHISIQDGDIKAAGSIFDIKVGSTLTITLNGKGVATEVLVTSTSGFGGFGGSFGGRGQGGKTQNNTNQSA